MKTERDISEIFESGLTEGLAGYSSYVEIGVNGVHRLWTVQRYDRRFFVKSLVDEWRNDHLCRLRLQKEFKLLLELSHPGVVRVFEFTDIPGLGPALLMEYMQGYTLAQWLEQPRSRKERGRVAEQLLDAVAYFHSKGVVHGDLKPQNIMVGDRGEHVKIIDFGLGDCADYALLKAPGGTQGYSAPEQFEPSYESHVAADIYALGRILQELNLGRGWNRAAVKAMAYEPKNRPQSVEELRSLAERRVCWYAAVGAMVAVLMAGVVWMLWPKREIPVIGSASRDIVSAVADTVHESARIDSSIVADAQEPVMVEMPTEETPPGVAVAPVGANEISLEDIYVPDEAEWNRKRDAANEQLYAEGLQLYEEMTAALEGVESGSAEQRKVAERYYGMLARRYWFLCNNLAEIAPREIFLKYGKKWIGVESLKVYPIWQEMQGLAHPQQAMPSGE